MLDGADLAGKKLKMISGNGGFLLSAHHWCVTGGRRGWRGAHAFAPAGAVPGNDTFTLSGWGRPSNTTSSPFIPPLRIAVAREG